MKTEGEAGNTGKPMAVDPGVEIYRGRSSGPYVPGTSWRTWWKLFNNFLVLRKVTEEKDQRLIFPQEVGNSNYELLESLLQGRELEDVELKDLRQAMERHYQPKKLILAERFGLMSKVQKPGQALHEYYAELQKAANSCNFEEIKNYRDAVVTMVFIGGLLSVETRKRLLEKEELTSKEALEQAEAFERVGENAPHLKEGPQAAGAAQEGLGKCTTSRAELKFKNEAVVPKFFRARPVPIALRPKVEAKLEEMIEYRRTSEFGNADGLSRLPDPKELPSAEMVINELYVQQMVEEAVENLPVTEAQIAKATKEDPLLQMVVNYMQKGWPVKVKDDRLKPYAMKRAALSIHNGCILWGYRVVIPKKFQQVVLKMLHNSHYGRNSMISLARTKIWFPGMDKAVEEVAKNCSTCAVMGRDPVRIPLHPWEEPEKVWKRLHIDFCETSGGVKWLVVVDAKSKWPEVIKMGTTTAGKTIIKLKEVFSRHGLPEQLVSDNGPPFTSAEFRTYCEKRGIEQIFTPPYHPNSNGEAERFVQTFKNALNKGLRSNKTVEDALLDLLFEYRVTPHVATGKAPAEMLMGRTLRTTLDIIRSKNNALPPNRYRVGMKKNYDVGKKERRFSVGQEVFIRNYTGSGDRWIPGIVVKILGTSTYEVHHGMGVRKIHADQMKERVIPWELADEELLRRMEKSTSKKNSELTEEPLPRRSKRKRQETATMTEFRESGKRRKISWIGLSEIEDVNKNSRYGVRPIKEAGRGRQLSYVLVASTAAAPAAAAAATSSGTHRGGGGGGPVGPAAEPPSCTSPGRDWSSSGGAVATDTSNGAGGMDPARKAGKTAPPTTGARSRTVVGVGRDPEGPKQKGGRRVRKEPFGIWGAPQPTAKLKKPQWPGKTKPQPICAAKEPE
ncbi:hypothetical protein V3C99_018378 [Haemonchus contortus]